MIMKGGGGGGCIRNFESSYFVHTYTHHVQQENGNFSWIQFTLMWCMSVWWDFLINRQKKTVKRFKKNPQRLLLLLSSHVTKSQRWCQRLIFEILMPYGLVILECIPLFKNLIIWGIQWSTKIYNFSNDCYTLYFC